MSGAVIGSQGDYPLVSPSPFQYPVVPIVMKKSSLASLSVANTWTAVQKFNAGIIFGGAGSIAGTNTFIEADGAGGNLLANVPTGKSHEWAVNGTVILSLINGVFQAQQDGFTSNTGFGTDALNSNSGNNSNSAFGYQALLSNTTGYQNSAFGYQALLSNTTGIFNCAFGYGTLYFNTTGGSNSAFGLQALLSNTTGSNNSAFGFQALHNFNDTTSSNDFLVAIGYQAGLNYTGSERNNIVIGASVFGVAGESNVLRLGPNIFIPNINTLVGHGLPAEYASTLTTAVALGTTSTVIKTYTPTAAGQFLVVVSVEASVASTISSLTVTYTDGTSGVSTTQTLATSVAVALNSAMTFTALCNATTASAISVQGTALAGTALYATATVLAL